FQFLIGVFVPGFGGLLPGLPALAEALAEGSGAGGGVGSPTGVGFFGVSVCSFVSDTPERRSQITAVPLDTIWYCALSPRTSSSTASITASAPTLHAPLRSDSRRSASVRALVSLWMGWSRWYSRSGSCPAGMMAMSLQKSPEGVRRSLKSGPQPMGIRA